MKVMLFVGLAAQVCWFLLTLATWLDEGNYLYKSSALVSQGMSLYSVELPCWYTPLYFVSLGIWQEAFGFGLSSGRTMSACLFVCVVLIVCLIARRVFKDRQAHWFLLVLILLTPSIAAFHSSVTQFAFCNLLLVGLLWIIFVFKNDYSRWYLAGLLMGAIAMTRPNMFLVAPLVPVLYLWINGWRAWLKPAIQFCFTWFVFDAVIIGVFGSGALWNMIRAFPGSTLFANVTGITANPAVGTLEGTDLGLMVSPWMNLSAGNSTSSLVYFFTGYLWPYLLILILNVVGLILWKKNGDKPNAAAGFAILFFWSSLLHFAATQTFSKSCAHGYMNYSIVFGLLGATGFLPSLLQRFSISKIGELRGKAVCFAVAAWVLMAWLPGGPYKKWCAPDTAGLVTELAKRLDQEVPTNAHILPLGMNITLVEGIHLAGRTADPLPINYFFSRREPIRADVPIESGQWDRIRQRGLWTDQMLKHWLKEEHDYVFYQSSLVPHRELLQSHFNSKPLFPDVEESDPRSTYCIATRKTAAEQPLISNN